MVSKAEMLLIKESVKKRVILYTSDGKDSSTVGEEAQFALVEPKGQKLEILFLDNKNPSVSAIEAKSPNYGVPVSGDGPFYVALPGKTKKVSVESTDSGSTLWFDFEAKRQKMMLVKDLPTYFDATLAWDLGNMKEGETTKWKDISTPMNRKNGFRVFKVSGSDVTTAGFSNNNEEFKHNLVQ